MMRPPLRFYAFWALNGPLDLNRMCRQLEAMRAYGLDGVVVQPRFYPNQPTYLGPEYLRLVSDAILHAKSLGLAVWLYDENGWPSGTADGALLRQYPESAATWLELSETPGDQTIRIIERVGRTLHLNVRRLPGIDLLDPVPCRQFLELVHERYRTGLAPEAWDHVEAIFSDEPETGLSWADLPPLGVIPWTAQMPAWYEQRFGADLLTHLPLLFERGANYRTVRVRFWEWVSDLLADGFIKPYQQWCSQHGKRFTAHAKGEEHPLFQVPMVGSLHRMLKGVDLPGIDALERDPSNDYYPRVATTAARQFSDGRVMAEAFGGAGWGARPEDFVRYIRWLARCGATDLVLHLWQYRFDSAAIRDWPMSIPNHLSWGDVVPNLLNQLREEFATPTPLPEVLLVAPTRAVMAEYDPVELVTMNIHDAGTYAETPAGAINDRFLAQVEELRTQCISYDVVDERTLELGGPTDEGWTVGARSYRQVILSPDAEVVPAVRIQLPPQSRPFAPSNAASSNAAPSIAQEIARLPLDWTLPDALTSRLPLEGERQGAGWWAVDMDVEPGLKLTLTFADEITRVDRAGQPLAMRPTEEGTTVSFTTDESRLKLRFFKEAPLPPLAWLSGVFMVPVTWERGPNQTLRCGGTFALRTARDVQSDLSRCGYAFADGTVSARTTLVTADLPARTELAFDGMAGDALHVWLNDHDLGYAIGPTFAVTLPASLPAGSHKLRVELIPSTFNRHGPFHHIDGDPRVVSPLQFEYRKNFADRPDAPDCTRVSYWHVKPLHLPSALLMTLPSNGYTPK